jgi:hypothetical protein
MVNSLNTVNLLYRMGVACTLILQIVFLDLNLDRFNIILRYELLNLQGI